MERGCIHWGTFAKLTNIYLASAAKFLMLNTTALVDILLDGKLYFTPVSTWRLACEGRLKDFAA